MAMLAQEMSLRSVTFTQDSESGTRTTLDVVACWLLNDEGVGAPGTGLVPANPNALPPVQPPE
jgi:hypothetical protein